jgi:hypothetical protein
MPAKLVTDAELLEAFDKVNSPIATTPDLQELVPMKRDGIRKRLIELEKEGRVKSKKVGARAVVWWRVN